MHRLRRSLGPGLFALVAAAAIPRVARAEVPLPPFGRAGQVIFDDVFGGRVGPPGYLGQLAGVGPLASAPPSAYGMQGIAGYARAHAEMPYQPPVTTTSESVWVAPALDVFVTHRLSLGVAAGFMYQHGSYDGGGLPAGYSTSAYTVSVVPRIGYVFPITPRLALWPRLGVGYSYGALRGHDDVNGTTAPSIDSMWLAGVDLGVVFRVTPWLFLHAAPSLHAAYDHAVNAGGTFDTFNIGFGFTTTAGISL